MITVRDISRKIFGKFEITNSSNEVFDRWYEDTADSGENPMNQIALATNSGRVVGWLGLDMLVTNKCIGECIDLVTPEMIMAAGTPLLEAAKAFATTDQHLFFTLEDNSLSGWLCYDDLFKLPFRLCLFSLLLGVEQLATDICKLQPGKSLNALSSGRLEKAKKTYSDRGFRRDQNGNESELELLDCTMFSDKIRILRKLFTREVPAASDSLFDFAECIRNDLAHPRDEDVIAVKLKRDKLLPFIEWSENVQKQMEQVLIGQ